MFKAKPLIKRINYGLIAMFLLAVQAIPMAALWTETASAASTAFTSPSASGNPDEWSNGSNALASGGGSAQTNDDDDDQGYRNFGFSIPNGSTIEGIEVLASARQEGESCQLQTRLSWNNGSNHSDRKSLTPNESGSFSNLTYGGANDTWGENWEAGDFTNANFVLEIRYNDPDSNCGNSDDIFVDHLQVKVHYTAPTPPIQPVANPALGQSCGLDIALVLDVSTSINDTELGQMRSAMQSFVTAFTGTPTEFSITKFATTGEVVSGFTDDLSQVSTTLGTVDGSGYTNWEDGLTKAQSTYDPRPGVPNMVIFASDGNPNTIGNGPGDNASPDGSVAAMNPAVTVANSLKTNQNAHILSLGIGDALSTSNLEKISGPGDVISSDFANLANDLAELAAQLCGGTITTTKLVDHDSNPNTAPINGGSGWNFNVDGGNYATDANGQTVAVDVGAGTYSVTETVQDGYELVSGSCTGATNNGQFNSNNKRVEGIIVDNNDIVSCQFINKPTKGTLIVKKVINGGNATYSDFQFKVNGGNPVAFENDGENSTTVNEGQYNVEEVNVPSGYTPAYSDDCTGSIVGGQTKTCTITNTYAPKPILDVVKYATNDNGGTVLAKDFNLLLNGGSLGSPDSSVDSTPNSTANYDDIELTNGENYTVSETPVAGYENTSTTCYDVTNGVDGAPVVAQPFTAQNGKKYLCNVNNDDITPKVIVKKIVKNMWGGTKDSSDFLLYLNGGQVTSGAENAVNIGQHTASEDNLPGYFGKFSGDCDPSGNISVQLLDKVYECVITNYDKPGKLIIKKVVINDDGGTKKAKDFKFKVNNGWATPFHQYGKYGFNYKLVPRGEYSVKEVYAPGYKTYYHGCKDIFVNNGEVKKCVIINNDIAPKLTLKKVIGPKDNRYGNGVPSDWTLSATPVYSNAPVIEGNGDPFSGNGVFFEKAVAGVVYKLSETGPAGYDVGEWVCYGKKGTYHIFHGDKLWMKPGAKVFCKIVNTEKAPKLTVIKNVVVDNGGKADIEDFDLKINDDALVFDEGVYNKATKTATYTSSLNVYAGQEYVLSEKDLEDYSEGQWVCTNEATGENLSVAVTLQLGDDVTCEITNNDIPPSPENPQNENPIIPAVITLPNTTGMNPVLIALFLGALTAIVMTSSMAVKTIVARRR